jgi:uncharacterized protein YndB with AHSA1/START domain
MYEFLAKCTIRVAPETVWEILTNAPGYAEWNPEIVAIEGRMALGERILALVKVGSGAIRTVPLRVIAFEAPSRMEWTGRVAPGSVHRAADTHGHPRGWCGRVPHAGADERAARALDGQSRRQPPDGNRQLLLGTQSSRGAAQAYFLRLKAAKWRIC